MAEYTVAQLANATGIPASTIRYYLREGIIKPKRVTPAGYRIFDDFTVEQLIEIKQEVAKRKQSVIQEYKKLKGVM